VIITDEICRGYEFFIREIGTGDEAHFFGAKEEALTDTKLPAWTWERAGFAFGDVSVDELVSACAGAVG